MGQIDWLSLVPRWVHILAALTAGGGILFARFALIPAVPGLPEGARQDFADRVRRHWAPFVHGCIALLLVSGIANIVFTTKSVFAGYDAKMCHMLFGIKFLLALAVFGISSVLNGSSAATQKMRQNPKPWASLNVVLFIVIVLISGAMRGMHTSANPDLPLKASPAAVQSE